MPHAGSGSHPAIEALRENFTLLSTGENGAEHYTFIGNNPSEARGIFSRAAKILGINTVIINPTGKGTFFTMPMPLKN